MEPRRPSIAPATLATADLSEDLDHSASAAAIQSPGSSHILNQRPPNPQQPTFARNASDADVSDRSELHTRPSSQTGSMPSASRFPDAARPAEPSVRSTRSRSLVPDGGTKDGATAAPKQENALPRASTGSPKATKTAGGAGKSDGQEQSRSGKEIVKGLKSQANEELLQGFRTSFDSLRSLVTCRVCVRLLYEPYMISCGHTFCYSCLCQWFVNNKARKTCPDCRSEVKHPPAPAFLVREMTEIFISRAELLPAGETVLEHHKWKKEESELIERDRNNKDPEIGGLFRGCFNHPDVELRAIRDDEDGVERCPMCAWELEDGLCGQCGLRFDDDGRVMRWGAPNFSFSDVDFDDFPSEDLDDEVNMEDDFGIDDESQWDDTRASYSGFDFYDDESYAPPTTFAIQRAINQGNIRPPRRAAFHSAAGSRRRSYTSSLVSDMTISEDGEMGTVEEESEEEEDDEPTSLDGFIVDDETDQVSRGSQPTFRRASQHPSQRRAQRTGPRAPPSDSVSTASHTQTEEDDDDYDEGGAVSTGRRRRPGQRGPSLGRLGRRGPIALTISDDEEHDLSESTQALLRSQRGWSQLDHDTADDMSETNDDDDDDDTMTTVGMPASTIGADRARLGGSLTPTADCPRPNIRPPSRVRNRVIDGSRGIRRRSSVLSVTSSAIDEDGEADDDDSDTGSVIRDRDGDVDMSLESPPQGATINRHARLPPLTVNRPVARREPAGPGPISPSLDGTADVDSDSTSDASIQPARRRRPRRLRQPEYNPMISAILARHQIDMRGNIAQLGDSTANSLEIPRTRTPVARPRTANRNRVSSRSGTPSIAPPFSPLSNGPLPPFSPPLAAAPLRSRTPSVMTTVSTSRSSESPNTATRASTSPAGNPTSLVEAALSPPPPSTLIQTNVNPDPAPLAQPSSSGTHDSGPAVPGSIERPVSRMSSISGSGSSSRRISIPGRDAIATFHGYPATVPFVAPSPGLNFAARSFQGGNPWAGYVRTRPSTNRLREQSSTATLRARNSRRELRSQPSQINIQDIPAPQPVMRPQASRSSLRPMPSQQRLRPQGSTQALRMGSTTPTPQSPIRVGATLPMPGIRHMITGGRRLSDEERRRLGSEVVRRRAEELGRQNSNPFAARTRLARGSQTVGIGSTSGQATEQLHTHPQYHRQTHEASVDDRSQLSLESSRAGIGPVTQRTDLNTSAPQGTLTSNTPSTSARQSSLHRGSRRNLRGSFDGSTMTAPNPGMNAAPVYTRDRANLGNNLGHHSNMLRGLGPMMAGGEPQRLG
ncbi:hypothetical protein L228DRAFT_281663 [Xylona heveae TC161]|uniref:RING-type domain-containing protein n=1 Tax=Xylona heveae (strain CBS 132557 / TC161) TaxID=1328760 RepID=A0A161TQI7_XYLHT|nr:hypothetical protein L228DRAFT_281663 [Xylona heveae TC161]KZF24606.1 hypothetical protein L228DRAFT_281663 [Xylona heveae TC161]